MRRHTRVFGPEAPVDHAGPRRCCWPKCWSTAELGPICMDHALTVHGDVSALLALGADAAERPPAERAPGAVYFIRLGDRVKIGFSRNLKARLVALPHEEVLAVVPGTVQDEKRCHAAFAHLRQTGEWFRAEPDLLAFIADVSARDGGSLETVIANGQDGTDPVCP